jgi:nickel-dependent lactate racemase
MVEVADPYDIIITTNSGYPLDQNLYQTVKGMSAAARIVRQGGTIIMAAACEDGLPDHGLYISLLTQAGSPKAALDLITNAPHTQHDQWQVQIQALVQQKADVFIFSEGLTPGQIRKALFEPSVNIEATVADLGVKYGADARICVMPEGPQTVAYLSTG